MNGTLVSSISTTQSAIASAIHVGLESKKRSEIKSAMSSTIEHIEDTLNQLPKVKHADTKKVLRVLSNTFQGVLNGIEKGEMTLGEIRPLIRNIRKRFVSSLETGFADISTIAEADSAKEKQHETEVAVATEKDKRIRNAIENATDFQSSLLAIKEKLVEEETQRRAAIASILDTNQVDDAITTIKKESHREFSRDDASLVKQLEMVREQAKDLTAAITKPFQIIKAPIVPIFEASRVENPGTGGAIRPYTTARNFKFDSKLKQLGIGHIMLNDYVILTSQMLLAVRSDFVSEYQNEQHDKNHEKFKDAKKKYKEWQSGADPEVAGKIDMKEQQRLARKALRDAERNAARVEKMTPAQYEKYMIEQADKDDAAVNRVELMAKMTPAEKAEFLREEKINSHTEAAELNKEFKRLGGILSVLHKKLDAVKTKFGYDAEPVVDVTEDGKKLKCLGYRGKPFIDPSSKSKIRITTKEVDKEMVQQYSIRVGDTWQDIEAPPPAPFYKDAEYKRLVAKAARIAPKVAELRFKIDHLLGGHKEARPATTAIQPRNVKVEVNTSDFASQLLDVLNDQSHIKYELVVKTAIRNPRNPNITLFWIMPSRILLNLSKGAGWGRVKNWGFPL